MEMNYLLNPKLILGFKTFLNRLFCESLLCIFTEKQIQYEFS